MKIIVKNFRLTAALKTHIHAKMDSVEKTFSLTDVTITVSKEKTSSAAQFLGRESHGGTVKIKCSAGDAYSAVDKLRNLCKEKLARIKEKKSGKRRTASPPLAAAPQERIRTVRISPMSRQEATDKMASRNYNFWLFVDRESGIFTALYRKEDGEMCVVHPVFEE